MTDRLIRALVPQSNVRVVVCVASDAAAEAARLHELQAGSAAVLSQGLVGALLVASLQKAEQRINLQLECDGPVRGFLVDASASGEVRGYVKNRHLGVMGADESFRWRPLLGNSGFLSVLRDIGEGEFYRSSVELQAMELGADLTRYFQMSDQVVTRCAMVVEPMVAGVLVQAMPGATEASVEAFAGQLDARLQAAAMALNVPDANALLHAVFAEGPALQVLDGSEIRWACSCNKQRVLNALSAMGEAELRDILATEKKAVATCQFCGRTHTADAADIEAILAKLTVVA